MRSAHSDAALDADALNRLIAERLRKANSFSDQTKKVVNTVSLALTTYLVTGKLSQGLGPAGAAVAEGAFLSQAGFFGGLWYGLFGVPAWVGVVGGFAGAGIGLLVAPLLGAFVEYAVNQRTGLAARFRERLDEVRDLMLDGKHDGPCSVEGTVASALQYLHQLVELADAARDALEMARRIK